MIQDIQKVADDMRANVVLLEARLAEVNDRGPTMAQQTQEIIDIFTNMTTEFDNSITSITSNAEKTLLKIRPISEITVTRTNAIR